MYFLADDWEAACPALKGKCQNEGYVKQDRSTKKCGCLCPYGTTGQYCENVEMSYNGESLEKCGDVLQW